MRQSIRNEVLRFGEAPVIGDFAQEVLRDRKDDIPVFDLGVRA